ncbi:hypothetical protein Pla108_02420 [Botrimarina colliarenosi]|uniref:Uncharacterized protein n=1 Tax=Botrimarina colliarenosi TaxID=2528001 RepID=A0A5C6AIK7_9BACT|nr:hypothetical protein [Botrimarina colliarenosi]TWT99307.1 hypothetical protein Pla108_02420 [Botrimarina colliarenosi]
MHRQRFLSASLMALSVVAMLAIPAVEAQARLRGRYFGPRVRYSTPYVGGRYGRYYRGPVGYRSGYRGRAYGYGGYGYGYGGYGRGVTIGAPGVGVRVGF